jgi:hypothetical protein
MGQTVTVFLIHVYDHICRSGADLKPRLAAQDIVWRAVINSPHAEMPH